MPYLYDLNNSLAISLIVVNWLWQEKWIRNCICKMGNHIENYRWYCQINVLISVILSLGKSLISMKTAITHGCWIFNFIEMMFQTCQNQTTIRYDSGQDWVRVRDPCGGDIKIRRLNINFRTPHNGLSSWVILFCGAKTAQSPEKSGLERWLWPHPPATLTCEAGSAHQHNFPVLFSWKKKKKMHKRQLMSLRVRGSLRSTGTHSLHTQLWLKE